MGHSITKMARRPSLSAIQVSKPSRNGLPFSRCCRQSSLMGQVRAMVKTLGFGDGGVAAGNGDGQAAALAATGGALQGHRRLRLVAGAHGVEELALSEQPQREPSLLELRDPPAQQQSARYQRIARETPGIRGAVPRDGESQ